MTDFLIWLASAAYVCAMIYLLRPKPKKCSLEEYQKLKQYPALRSPEQTIVTGIGSWFGDTVYGNRPRHLKLPFPPHRQVPRQAHPWPTDPKKPVRK